MKCFFTHYICVSTEDDTLLIKGGIGTYLGLLKQAITDYFPNSLFIWITEAADNTFYVKKGRNYRIFYIPRNNTKIGLFKEKIEKNCSRILSLLDRRDENKIIIESPDWEGLLSNLYQNVNKINVLKITKLHSILLLTKQLEKKIISDEEKKQIQAERKQIFCSDIISCPSQYVYNFTRTALGDLLSKIPYVIIPNFINTKFLLSDMSSKKDAVLRFNSIYKRKIISENSKNVFIIGSMEKRKGTDLSIKIAKKAIIKNKKIYFYFLGHYEKNGNSLTLNSKYSKRYLLKKVGINYNKNINFCGFFPHKLLPIVYNAADAFLFCYRHDNFPGALVEAALSGKNIAFLATGGCLEIMQYKKKVLGFPFFGTTDMEIVSAGFKSLMEALVEQKKTARYIQKKYETEILLNLMMKNYTFDGKLKFGNFSVYNLFKIRFLLFKYYRLNASNINIFNNAMDNTVLDIDDKYILKIYETKTKASIKKSLVLFDKYRDFYMIDMIKTKNNALFVPLDSKFAVLYEKKQFSRTPSFSDAMALLSDFHKKTKITTKLFSLKTYMQKTYSRLLKYLSPMVFVKLGKTKRIDLYMNLLQKVRKKEYLFSLELPYGVVHGDPSFDNIICVDVKTYFIDHDSIKEDFLFMDIVDFFIRLPYHLSTEEKSKILKKYLIKQNYMNFININAFLYIIEAVSGIRALEAALSTEYYCYEKKKFSEETLENFFLDRILILIKNAENILGKDIDD